MNKELPVLVTGGSGYLASWIVKKFLSEGFKVHTTVRDPDDESKIKHLIKLNLEHENRLKIYKANLLENGSFDKAMQNCEFVIHTASPFFTFDIKDAQTQLIIPAVNGTKNVINAVNRTKSVKKVVLTSSVAAIYSDAHEVRNTLENIFTEDYWNTNSSEKHNPYSYSKIIAEKTAWEMAKIQDRWTLTVINPGFIMGPSLTPRTDSTSIDFLIKFSDGTFKMGVPDLYFGVVDVRDVADAHFKAIKYNFPERHILVADTINIIDFAIILKEKYDGKYLFPSKKLANWLLYVFGFMQGITTKFLRLNIGIPMYFDNKKSKKNLKIKYRPINQTITEHFQQMIDDKIISN